MVCPITYGDHNNNSVVLSYISNVSIDANFSIKKYQHAVDQF